MSTRPPKVCATPMCGQTVQRGHCAKHARERATRRGTTAQRGYSGAHVGWRQAILALDPICRGCEIAPSTHAEHVIPWQQGGEQYAIENGQGCCASCANYKSRIEQREPDFGTRLRAAGAKLPLEEYADPITGEAAYRKPPAPKGWRVRLRV